MSAKSPTGYAKIISNLPLYFFYIAVLAVALEFLPNQKGIIGILNSQYKNMNTSISKSLENSSGNNNQNFSSNDSVTGIESYNSELKDFKITKIVDGDTLEVQKENKSESGIVSIEKYKVRLLGINTPESVDPRREVECFGKEASEYAKKNFLDETVRLETDNSQSKYDKYNRLLAYIYLSDGQMLNRKLIADGYAYEYTYDKAYKYQKDFKDIQRFAKSENRGLWSADTCNGVK